MGIQRAAGVFEDTAMNCPRCECHIADGFYCIGCGYVPTDIDARTNTDVSNLDITIPQVSRRIPASRCIDWLTDRMNLSSSRSLSVRVLRSILPASF
jgi:hypothetical protein